MYVYIYAYIYVFTYIYIYIYMCIYVSIDLIMFVCIRVGYKQTFWLDYKLAYKLDQSTLVVRRAVLSALYTYVCMH